MYSHRNEEIVLERKISPPGPPGSRLSVEKFDRIYIEHNAAVYRMACFLTKNKSEAEDLYQETWLRVVSHFDRIRDSVDPKAWIFTIAVNLHRDALRKKRVRHRYLAEKKGELSGHSNRRSQPGGEENSEMQMAISRALSRLPRQLSHIFVLKEMCGFKYDEISEILSVPVGTVKSTMHRAVKKLQRELAGYNPFALSISRGKKCNAKMLSV
jgi:RNA polymerase sigma-70 factor (ECF subfamily)